MKSNERKLAEEDESILMASEIPYTIIRAAIRELTEYMWNNYASFLHVLCEIQISPLSLHCCNLIYMGKKYVLFTFCKGGLNFLAIVSNPRRCLNRSLCEVHSYDTKVHWL
ncbi:hypothetical protein ABKV19_016966 [Rosa sericea]